MSRSPVDTTFNCLTDPSEVTVEVTECGSVREHGEDAADDDVLKSQSLVRAAINAGFDNPKASAEAWDADADDMLRIGMVE